MEGFKDVVVRASPVRVTTVAPENVSFLVLITNTGNLDDHYLLTATSGGGTLPLEWSVDRGYIPAQMTAGVLPHVPTAGVGAAGTYDITVRASSTTSTVQDDDVATLALTGQREKIYLPIIQQ